MVNITEETRLSAFREISGNLIEDAHSATLVLPDGTTVAILPVGYGYDQVQYILQPGTYEVGITVRARQYSPWGVPIDPHLGHVVLKWEDPGSVAVTPLSWSSLKALFR